MFTNTIDATFVSTRVEQLGWTNEVSPAFSFCEFGQIGHQASLNQIFSVTAGVQLRRCHWVATSDPGKDNSASVITASNCRIYPLVAGSVYCIGEYGHSRSFTTRSPPVGDFHLFRPGQRLQTRREQQLRLQPT